MGQFTKTCEKCGTSIRYEYDDNDDGLRKKRLGSYLCFDCIEVRSWEDII